MRSRLFLLFLCMLGCVSTTLAQVKHENVLEKNMAPILDYAGLKSSFAPSLLTPTKNFAIDYADFLTMPAPILGGDCNKNLQGLAAKPEELGIIGSAIANHASCNDLIAATYPVSVNDRFTQERCEQLVNCNQVMSAKDTLTTDVAKIIPQIIAEDFVGEKIEDNLEKMLQLEKVRKYAEKKNYGSTLSLSCSPRFLNSDPIHCQASLVDQGFKRLQKFCSFPHSYCLREQKDYLATFEQKSPEDGTSQLNTLLNNRIDASVNEALANDEELILNLGRIISGDEDLANRKKNAVTFVEKYKGEGKLDPILTYTEEQARLRSLIEIMTKGKFSTAQIRKGLEEFRRDAARVILKDCTNSLSFEKLCKGATDVQKAQKTFVFERSTMASRIRTEDDDERLSRMMSLFPNAIKTKFDYELMMDAYRCKAFKFAPGSSTGHNNYLYSEFRRVPELEKLLGHVVIEGGLRGPSVGQGLYSPSSPRNDDIRRNEGSPSFSMGDNLRTLNGANLDNAPSAIAPSGAQIDKGETGKMDSQGEKIKSYDEKGNLTNTWATGLKETSTQLSSQGVDVNRSYSNSNFQGPTVGPKFLEAPEAQAERKKSGGAPAEGSYYGEKINELTKKLAQSEEGLENLKAEKIAAEKAALHQKKMDEETKTIAELREQINDLKAESKTEESKVVVNKKARKDEMSIAADPGPAPSAKSNGTQDDFVAATAKSQNSMSVMGPHADNSSQVSSGGREESVVGQSGHKAQSASAGGGSSATGAGFENNLSLILSKSDALSNEKIYDKIFELKGEGFFIEEGGVVKEIRPLLINNEIAKDKSGKPIFETIILGDKEALAKNKKARAEKKERTSIKSNADLKRDQEEKMKHDPAQYMKLKKLTNDVWNNKTE